MTKDRPRTRRRLWITRALQVLLGLSVGLLLAELGFRWRDHGAFPHLNAYVPDPDLGVRLQPGATEVLAFGGNPATHIRINADGYRGADLPPASESDILVVGDSQVFGLGVEEDQTFSARLARALGGKRVVINAGVPTYGPDEYRAVAAEMLARRHPGTVVFTVNMVNDLFEAAHENTERHAVWDGWAVRKESAPDSVLWFPGRHLLFNRSHLVFALRRWWYHRGPRIDERGFASEGTWRDLIGAGVAASSHRQANRLRTIQWRNQRSSELAGAEKQLVAAREDIDDSLWREVLRNGASTEDETVDNPQFELDAARANPGDIVEEADPYAEGGRQVIVTAEIIRRAARYRAKLQEKLLERARARGDEKVLAAFAARDRARARLADLDHSPGVELPRIESPLAPVLRDMSELCRAHGSRLIVLVLPIDVQVSADEWKKYGAEPLDMASTRVLIDDVLADARALGVSAVDASAALAAAEPGAFLDRDVHMSPRGHQAVAAALAKAIAAAPPEEPLALSAVPIPSAFDAVGEVIVTGSTRAGCETKMVREWLRVACHQLSFVGPSPTGVRVVSGGHGAAMTLHLPEAATLLAPVVEGDELAAEFTWTDRTQTLRVTWPEGAEKPTMSFGAPVKGEHPKPALTPLERDVCRCWTKQYGSPGCSAAYGEANLDCQSYGDDCPRLLECIRRDPASLSGGSTL